MSDAFSVEKLKPIIKQAYYELTSTTEWYSWDKIISHIQRHKQAPAPILLRKDEILWEMLGDLDIASVLVQSHANLTTLRSGDKTKSTFLHVLSASNDSNMHKLALLMIGYGRANVNALDANGRTPLHVAIKSGAFTIIEAIVIQMNWINTIFDCCFDDCVVLAAQNPDAEQLLKSLFKNSIHGISRNSKGLSWDIMLRHHVTGLKTILQLADKNRFDIMDYVFKSSSLENLKFVINSGWMTPQKILSCEFILKEPVMILFLIKEGADINEYCVSEEKKYPLHISKTPETVQFLLQLGADINVLDKFNNTLFLYCQDGLGPISNIMIKHLAILVSKGGKILETDLSLMKKESYMQKFYIRCIAELDKMKKMNIVDNFPYYWFISKTSYQISTFLRGIKMFKQLRNNLLQLDPQMFPIYKDYMTQKLGISKQIKNRIDAREQELMKIFNDLKNISLPRLAIREIAMYSFDHVNFEREYYASNFQRII